MFSVLGAGVAGLCAATTLAERGALSKDPQERVDFARKNFPTLG